VRSHFSRVKVGRGPVIVPESVAARGYWKPRRGDRPFPNPAHRTVHAVFPHTALGRVSHRGMRKRPQMKAPKLEHPQLPEHPRAAGKRCVPREGTGCLLGLGVQYLLESLELRWSYQAHANLPPLASVRHAPNQGPFPLVMLSRRSARYCGPLRLPGRLPSRRRGEGRDPSPPWVSRVALGSVPTCHAPYPGERPRPPRSVPRTASSGLPGYSGRSALASSLSRPARASHVLRPVGLPIRPWRTHVPRASASWLPFSPPR
jgi:hypothetical protein